MGKIYLKKNVLEAAKERIKNNILHFDDFYVSFSGGKDSGVLVNLVIDIAKELNRLPVKVLFSDLEVIFQQTVDYTLEIMDRSEVEPYWLCLEELEENASSVYERYYKTWDSSCPEKWIRPMPDRPYIITKDNMPELLKKHYHPERVEKWTITQFGKYLLEKTGVKNICNFIGLRSDESYGRYMCVKTEKNRNKLNNHTYTTLQSGDNIYISIPLYDWELEDVWKYYAETRYSYNKIYDQMYMLGLNPKDMRTCFALGEEQKKTIYYWKVFEPKTFERMLQRVEGVNFGNIYNHTNLNRGKVKKPDNVTWKEYLDILMAGLPEMARANFEDKFKIVFRYHKTMYEEKEGIPPEVYIQDSKKEAKAKAQETGLGIKYFISYETLCGAIIRRDFVFKKYGFGYSNKMSKRIEDIQQKWGEKL